MLSVIKSAHAYAPVASWHAVSPFLQLRQLPAAQIVMPPSNTEHISHLAPHCVTDVSETQLPPQSCVPLGHDVPQLVPSQVAEPPSGVGQGVHALPQVAGSRLLTH